MEIKELRKELEKSNEIKEQYKVYYDKIRAELVKIKQQNDQLKEDLNNKNREDLEGLRNEIKDMKNKQNI
jgi:centrosomal protein CEP120